MSWFLRAKMISWLRDMRVLNVRNLTKAAVPSCGDNDARGELLYLVGGDTSYLKVPIPVSTSFRPTPKGYPKGQCISPSHCGLIWVTSLEIGNQPTVWFQNSYYNDN